MYVSGSLKWTSWLFRNKKKAIFHCKTGGYNPNQDTLNQLPRHQQTSAQCPWGEADHTPEHYLQSCSLHQEAMQQICPLVCPSKQNSGGLQRICSWHPSMRHSRERGSSQRNHHIDRRRTSWLFKVPLVDWWKTRWRHGKFTHTCRVMTSKLVSSTWQFLQFLVICINKVLLTTTV